MENTEHKVTYVKTEKGQRIYWHDFTTGHQELIFRDDEQAKRFEKSLNNLTNELV